MSLIKSKLIQNITEANPHLFVRDVERIVNTIFNEITHSLSEGKRVELRGFELSLYNIEKKELGEIHAQVKQFMLKRNLYLGLRLQRIKAKAK